MPGNPIHMDHNFPLKLVQNEENTGKEREAGREPCEGDVGSKRKDEHHTSH